MHPKLSERIRRIADDTSHGGSWLAREAVETVVEASDLGEDPVEVGRALVSARPAMGAIAGAVGRVLAAGRSPAQLVEEANALIAGRDRAAKAIAVLLQGRIRGVVMTHSASSTVREALLHFRPERVICTVSEPVGEGRSFSDELREAGLAVDLVADEDAPRTVVTADVLLLGADTVFRDGTLVNKVGTQELAREAAGLGVPVLVACEVIKLAPTEAPEAAEEHTDITPPQLIDNFVTEEGVFPPEEITSLVDRTPFLVEGYGLLSRARR
jgi:translation initiation factor eIF-2B subunit delta/methylthioribose-1-phosphate isomerase